MPCLRSFCILLALSPVVLAEDWPQWLGPRRDGSSTEKVSAWKAAPKVIWRKPVGEGHSSPVVADGRVLVHAKAKGKEAEVVTAFDAKTGKQLWQATYPRVPFKNPFGNGPRATPSVVDGKAYTFGVTGVLTCYDAKAGKQLWQVDTLKEFKAKNLFFGMSCSPLVEDGMVLMNIGGAGASIVAFDKDKGTTAWKALDDGASYSSPVVFGKGKARQAVFLTKKGLVGLAPASGDVFWKFGLVDKLSESSTTPVRVGDMLLGSSVTYGSVGLQLGSKDGKPTAKEIWKKGLLTCYFSTPVPVGNQVYMINGRLLPPPSATLRCIDAKTGKVLWKKDSVGKYHASLMRTANDKLLVLDDVGNLILLEPNPKKYEELARSKVCGATWAHPALANGKLFIRDGKELICIHLAQ